MALKVVQIDGPRVPKEAKRHEHAGLTGYDECGHEGRNIARERDLKGVGSVAGKTCGGSTAVVVVVAIGIEPRCVPRSVRPVKCCVAYQHMQERLQ